MSNRLTTKWTSTAEEAYGKFGKQGRVGELWLAEFLRKQNFEVSDSESSKDNQVKGIDLTINSNSLARPYTIDVKTNLQNNGVFFIETSDSGWLLNPNKTSDCIWHVNPVTKEMAWYSRSKMKTAIRSLKVDRTFKHFFNNPELLKLNIRDLPTEMSFIRRVISNQADKIDSSL